MILSVTFSKMKKNVKQKIFGNFSNCIFQFFLFAPKSDYLALAMVNFYPLYTVVRVGAVSHSLNNTSHKAQPLYIFMYDTNTCSLKKYITLRYTRVQKNSMIQKMK